MIRELIKKIVPQKILFFCVNIVHPFFFKHYQLKFKILILRKNTSDKNVFRQIFITKDYNISLKINPKLIIDAGANVGYSSLWFMKKYPNAKIIAIEPEESNYNILKENTKRWKKIVPIKAGLWYKKTKLKIINNTEEKWAFQTKEISSKEKGIDTVTIGEILKKSGCDKIDILKMDVEGAEKEIFSKNTEWLKKVKILIIELHDWLIPNSSDSFYSVIDKKEWNICKKGENLILVRK